MSDYCTVLGLRRIISGRGAFLSVDCNSVAGLIRPLRWLHGDDAWEARRSTHRSSDRPVPTPHPMSCMRGGFGPYCGVQPMLVWRRDLTVEGSGTREKKWLLRLAAVSFAAFLALGISAGSAIAGSSQSAYGYYTVNGHQYKNVAVVATQSNFAQALTQTWWSTGSVTSGWAGARGRLFTSGGSLSCEGSNQYNTTTGERAQGFSCSRTSSGAWYSYGVSLAWTGSGYQSFYTFQSPNQNS
jgi:hypothetical protein